MKRILLLSTCLLACSLARSESAPAPDHYRPARPGLLYYAKAEYAEPAMAAPAVANPHISGALFQVIWSEVETADGVCDWSALDRWIQPWLDAGKDVAVRLMWSTSGYWRFDYYKHPTPSWVWDKGAKYAYHAASETEIPLIWDPIYQHYAWRFMQAFNKRYGDNPHLIFVDVTPGAETNPYRFGTIARVDPGFKDLYAATAASDGRTYSYDLWLETLDQWFDAIDHTFTATRPLVTLNIGGLPGEGSGDRLIQIGNLAASRGFHVGQNGLNARTFSTIDNGRTRAYLRWADHSGTFFEMVQKSGGRTGTLMEVMQAAERGHLLYLNTYPEDVLLGSETSAHYDPTFAAALAYGAEAIRRNHPDLSAATTATP